MYKNPYRSFLQQRDPGVADGCLNPLAVLELTLAGDVVEGEEQVVLVTQVARQPYLHLQQRCQLHELERQTEQQCCGSGYHYWWTWIQGLPIRIYFTQLYTFSRKFQYTV